MFIDADGSFYPCERVSEKSSIMRIGNLTDGFDLERIQEMINISQLTELSKKLCQILTTLSLVRRLHALI